MAARPKFKIQDFCRKQWQKKATVVQAPAQLASISANTIFSLLVCYCDQARATDSVHGLKFYVSGIRLEPFEVLENLPLRADKNFAGYHRRMSRRFNDYGLVCDELYSVMNGKFISIQKKIHSFADELYAEVGIPNRFVEVGLYLGNYQKTPFGVHVDPCGVLSLPVVGKKTFRIWPQAIVDKYPELKESFSYDEFKSQSSRLVVKPGEMGYWPSTDWHIAEGEGSFSATWSLGVWVDLPTSDAALQAIIPVLTRKLHTRLQSRGERTSLKYTAELPDELEMAAAAISKLSRKEIRKALARWWKLHLRSKAFKSE